MISHDFFIFIEWVTTITFASCAWCFYCGGDHNSSQSDSPFSKLTAYMFLPSLWIFILFFPFALAGLYKMNNSVLCTDIITSTVPSASDASKMFKIITSKWFDTKTNQYCYRTESGSAPNVGDKMWTYPITDVDQECGSFVSKYLNGVDFVVVIHCLYIAYIGYRIYEFKKSTVITTTATPTPTPTPVVAATVSN